MNLKKLSRIVDSINKVTDGMDQRARHAAISMLVNSGLEEEKAKQLVYSLYHSIPSLKDSMKIYVEGVVRWYLEGDIDLSSSKDLSRVNTFLKVLANSPARDALDRNFYSEFSDRLISFDEAKELVNVDTDIEADFDDIEGHNYTVVRIHSFEELQKYAAFAPKWCISSSEEAYNAYTINGTNKLYLCLRDDYKEIPATPGENNPRDAYGCSMIAVITDPDLQFASTTSRWNSSEEADNFINENQLKELIGEDEFVKLYRINDMANYTFIARGREGKRL